MMRSENPVYFPLPVLDNRFTSNELDELLSFFQPAGNAADVYEPREPLSSSPSGSDNPMDPFVEEMDEKRKKRNRESARRSRLRKKRHIENMRSELNRLKAQNRDYNNRLSLVLTQLHAVETQNELIRFESVHLIQRHTDLNRVLKDMRYSRTHNYLFNNNMSSGRFVNENGLFDQLTTEMPIN